MPAAPSGTQPPPVGIAAANSCQGASASAQPIAPAASSTAPVVVVAGIPSRRWIWGRQATTPAPHRKWSVTAAETSAGLQPVRAMTACRKTGGP